MPDAWLELKYGLGADSITLARLRDPEVLAAFKARALDRATGYARESEGVDEVVNLQDRTELTRLQQIFNLIE